MSSSRKTKLLKDVSHDHKLELIRFDKKADISRCVACTQCIIDNSYYKCPQVECDYFLHKFCGELPLEMKHGTHPKHPLTLNNNNRRGCDGCGELPDGYFYGCEICDFDLDLVCATSADRQLEHPGHPHPLTLMRTEIQAVCNCCGKKQEGIFYQCLKCVIFWIHEDCASFGTQADSPNHPHPLHFEYSHQRYYSNIKCDICYETITIGRSWYLNCVPCEFLSHVHCALFEEVKEVVEESNSEIPHLPWEGSDSEFGVVGLLNRKIPTNGEELRITHFSHAEHELILHDKVPRVEDPYHGHQIPLSTKCNGCTRKISSPFYSCMDCDFFLHKCCAFLPTPIPHNPFHPEHPLVLSTKPWRVDEVFVCHCCMRLGNGFYYECENKSCICRVDVECAFLPTSIVHKSHPTHLLTFSTKSSLFNVTTNCCIQDCFVGYVCLKCPQFRIHISCAMYPGKASHRFDHEKPFELWYNRGAVEANYFYCEHCEEPMKPKEWYYHSKSSVGDQLMHPKCILQREHPLFPNFKSTRNFLQVDIHPHRLHLSTFALIRDYSRNNFSELCGYCENDFKQYEFGDEKIKEFVLSYNCWEPYCGFRLHHSCAKKLQGTSIGVEEYPDESF